MSTKPSITATNLRSLSELMIAENLQYKKCMAYQSQIEDKALQSIFGDIAHGHKERYDKLFAYLDGHK
ncbi:MAG: hypothetical protein LBU60_05760 [Clostridiales bacterium]|nr:hypothetical protein [Clostridiales bacterium]